MSIDAAIHIQNKIIETASYLTLVEHAEADKNISER